MFLIRGNRIDYVGDSMSTMPQLEPALYKISADRNGFFLEFYHKEFVMPEKLYDKEEIERFSTKVLKHYNHSKNKNTGVLLEGLKGTGKTIQAKHICQVSNLPVLILSDPFCGSSFNSFIDTLNFKCIILIDEFEKLYQERDDQNSLLTFLDGTSISNKLIIMTANSSENLSDYFFNRPGRLRYHKYYNSLSTKLVEEVSKDLLEDKDTYLQDLKQHASFIPNLNMDILISVIQECNLHKEDIKQIFNDMCLMGEEALYNASFELDGINYTAKIYSNLREGYISETFVGTNAKSNKLEKESIFFKIEEAAHSIDSNGIQYLEIDYATKRGETIKIKFERSKSYKDTNKLTFV